MPNKADYYILGELQTVTKGKFYLMEHKKYGEEDSIITDNEGHVIIASCYNGFDDLIDYFDSGLSYGQAHLL